MVVAAGDLALRGAHPRETAELLFDRCQSVLLGNTDCYIAGNYLGGAYREREHWKRDLLQWTRDQLGPELTRRLGELPFSVRYSPRRGQDLYVCHANPRNLEESVDPTLDEAALRRFFAHLDAAACAFGHLHFPYRRRYGRMLLADVASAGIPRDGDVRPAYASYLTPRGWRVQIRRVRYSVRRATQAITARRVPAAAVGAQAAGARYRHHGALLEAARRHSGLPPAPFRLPHEAPHARAPGDNGSEEHSLPGVTPPEGVPAELEASTATPAMAHADGPGDGDACEDAGNALAGESRTLTFR